MRDRIGAAFFPKTPRSIRLVIVMRFHAFHAIDLLLRLRPKTLAFPESPLAAPALHVPASPLKAKAKTGFYHNSRGWKRMV